MITLQLTKGYNTILDEEDLPLVLPYKWRAEVTDRGVVYAVATTCVEGKKSTIRMHSIIAGTVGEGQSRVPDHKNGNGLDNRRLNLRVVPQQHNTWNARAALGSKYKGVTKQKRLVGRPWQARIHRNGTTLHLGYFPTEEEAATAYDDASKLTDGEFARLNNSGVRPTLSKVRQVVSRSQIFPNDGSSYLEYVLECGHKGRVPWWRRSKVGVSKHCKECL